MFQSNVKKQNKNKNKSENRKQANKMINDKRKNQKTTTELATIAIHNNEPTIFSLAK